VPSAKNVECVLIVLEVLQKRRRTSSLMAENTLTSLGDKPNRRPWKPVAERIEWLAVVRILADPGPKTVSVPIAVC
jgi:hypothetical protein